MKLGLGLLSVSAIATFTSLSNRIDETIKADYESQVKSLTGQLGMKDIEVEQKEKSVTELKQKHESELADLKQSYRQEIAELAAENQQSFEHKISLTQRKHALEIEKLRKEHEGEIRASDEIITILRKEKKQLQGNIETLQKQFDSMRDDFAQRVKSLESERENLVNARREFEIEQKEWNVKRAEINQSANQQLFHSSKAEAQAIDAEWQKLRSAQLQFNQKVIQNRDIFRQTQAENEALKKRLTQVYQAYSKNNGRYNLTSLEGFTANAIERFFARQQLPVSYLQGEEVKTQDRLSLKFAAKEENKAKIIKLADALSADVFSGKPVSIRRKDGYLIIDVPLEDRIDMGTVSNPENQSHTHFNELVPNSNHYIIMGGTGDGKTTLISNILELAGDLLQTPEVRLLNPKPTGADFYFRGDRIRANYLNTETPSGCKTPNCREGLEQLLYILSDRMAQAQRIEEKNENRPEGQQIPFPKFSPMLILILECNYLRSVDDDMKKLFDDVVSKLSKLGREYNIICVLEGQDTTCGEWGMRRAAFQCFSRLYLSSVLNVSNVESQEIKYLPNATEVRSSIEEFKSKRSTDKHNPHNFYGLFIRQGNAPGYVAYLPKPNHFHLQKENALHCPSCGSQDVVKNGIKHDKQNYLCKSCETQFTGEYVDTHSEDLAGIS